MYEKNTRKRLDFNRLALIITQMISAIMICSNLAACISAPASPVPNEPEYVVVARPASAPEGVVRYCWEEPIVDYERNGPGLDPDGKWYSPSYIAVREVRSGRWRPCKALRSEVTDGRNLGTKR